MTKPIMAVPIDERGGHYQFFPRTSPQPWNVIKGDSGKLVQYEHLVGWDDWQWAMRFEATESQIGGWFFLTDFPAELREDA